MACASCFSRRQSFRSNTFFLVESMRPPTKLRPHRIESKIMATHSQKICKRFRAIKFNKDNCAAKSCGRRRSSHFEIPCILYRAIPFKQNIERNTSHELKPITFQICRFLYIFSDIWSRTGVSFESKSLNGIEEFVSQLVSEARHQEASRAVFPV